MLATGLFAAVAALAAGPVLPDPYAATAPGWFLCQSPDDSDLTCSDIVSFERVDSHSYRSHAISNWSGTDYILEYDRDVRVVDGKDCMALKQSTYQNMRIRRGERVLTGRERGEAEARMRRELAGAGNMGTCTTIAGEANTLTMNVELVGEPKPGYYVVLRSLQYPLKWVHRDDGYKVRPWSALKS